METERYSLDNKESSAFVKIIQIIFGIVCIAVAIWWAWFIIKSEGNNNYWLATLFMLFFGAFQIYSGLGYAAKYIDIHNTSITFKRTAVGLEERVAASDVGKIEILPLTVRIVMKTGKSYIIRFGMSIATTIDSIKDALIEWTGKNNVEFEEKSDRI